MINAIQTFSAVPLSFVAAFLSISVAMWSSVEDMMGKDIDSDSNLATLVVVTTTDVA